MKFAIELDMEQRCAAVLAKVQSRRAAIEAQLAQQPQAKPCTIHPHVTRPLDMEATYRATPESGELAVKYAPCPVCVAARAEREMAIRLMRQGVPPILIHATFDNWTPDDDAEASHLDSVRQFAVGKRGFLVLLGLRGNGKTHLAVATMRQFRSAWLVEQAELLGMLRKTYRDKAASDPVEKAKEVDLLVIDEMGLSSGGRDELPMLHEILVGRHRERKPTILTSNRPYEEVQAIIGEPMADRLRESAYKILTFSGRSRRPEARQRYFEDSE